MQPSIVACEALQECVPIYLVKNKEVTEILGAGEADKWSRTSGSIINASPSLESVVTLHLQSTIARL